MRVSDLSLSNSYLNDISSTKSKIDKLSRQVSNQSSILRPSDSPTGTSKILRLNNTLGSNDIFLKNIDNSLGFVNESIRGMETLEGNVTDIRTMMAEINNAVNETNLDNYADQLDQYIDAFLDSANIQYDGKYVFGGTDFSSKPYTLTSDKSAVDLSVQDNSGQSKVKISNGINQKVNISGSELFGNIIKQNGRLDKTAANGTAVNDSISVYDIYNNEYTAELKYTKTAANTYDLTYDIKDNTNTSIYTTAPAAKELVFDDNTGNLISVDGESDKSIFIHPSSKKINFDLDLTPLTEDTSTSVSLSANQQQDIFNTLIKIRDDLKNGNKPDGADVTAVENFHQKLLNKLSEAGYISNNLSNTQELLENQKVEVQGLISKEKDLDIAKAVIDLQNYDYLLQVSYKMSSMILPKSLLDFI